MIIINGVEKKGYEGMSLAAVLEKECYQPERIAVEKNQEIIAREMWNIDILAEGDVLEVVNFVGGGSC